MESTKKQTHRRIRTGWRFPKTLTILLYISLFVLESKCQTESQTKIDNLVNNLDKQCHSCQISNKDVSRKENNENGVDKEEKESFVEELMLTVGTFTKDYLLANKTEQQLETEIESLLDDALSKEKYEIFDGVEIKSVLTKKSRETAKGEQFEGRALFPKYSYEYRLYQKVKTFVDNHILSINIPKAAKFVGFRSFGLKKLFFPLLIGAQIFKSVLLAMFLPSILGSFGKILGKGISQLSAASSQASYPPANNFGTDEQGYATDQKDFMGYETNPTGTYAYPQDEEGDANDLSNIDMSRFGASGQKVSFLPSKNNYYKNQMATAASTYKVFQKIPASSMILSNYDPFYSPLLSRLDGIFARLGLAPSENAIDDGKTTIGGQSLSDAKLESCREQLICLMYSSPAKYAPYSNLVSAQLSRELNELRRPVSDNPEILRFFRYMRAARRGQEGADCMRTFGACAANTAPEHTMIAAYHDINKLVTARKLH